MCSKRSIASPTILGTILVAIQVLLFTSLFLSNQVWADEYPPLLNDIHSTYRFWENGMSVVYLPSARMYHAHQRQSHAGHGLFDIFARKETRWHIADAVRYFRKHGVQGIRPTSPNNQSSGQIQLIA